MSGEFQSWFARVMGDGRTPHSWQTELGQDARCRDRLLRIPTGFGKTAGVVLTWLYHCVQRNDSSWPRRLAFALPMRVLVEQTAHEVQRWLGQAGLDQVGLEVLMGGEDAGDWAREPERPYVLIGTQDMLLSRALNRGYGAGRARWPVDFGLLSQDTLWVFDEIQLMGNGLMTAAQLAAFRADDAERRGSLRPCHSWWMSATLQAAWLESLDTRTRLETLRKELCSIPAAERHGDLWEISKGLERAKSVAEPKELADLVAERHCAGTLTLVVVNRVDDACAVFDALADRYSEGKGAKKARSEQAPELRLVHSRFRGAERERWAAEFLSRDTAIPDNGRVVVATQVIEAGVDLSAKLLVTALAPWPSLVQRFGRCARYAGQSGTSIVVGSPPEDEKKARPYALAELASASEGLDRLMTSEAGASIRALEAFEEKLRQRDPEFLERLYPYDPDLMLRRNVLDELFDTTPDLTGADLDVSQYVRGGEERDVSVFWRAIEPKDKQWPGELTASEIGRIGRRELCPVPLHRLREWMNGRNDEAPPVYGLDYNKGHWVRLQKYQPLVAGQQVLLPLAAGAYDSERGFDPKSKEPVSAVSEAITSHAWGVEQWAAATRAEDDDSLSITSAWKTIATHTHEAAAMAVRLAQALALPPELEKALSLAARWHDVGKAHPIFQQAIRDEARNSGPALAQRRDLAKAPKSAWSKGYMRPGFRHELASTLAMFDLLRRHAPEHPALRGGVGELLALLGDVPHDSLPLPDSVLPFAEQLAQLDSVEFNLVAFLVCAHHGKVRCSWTSTPKDQKAGRGHVHGVEQGEELPAFELMVNGGERRSLEGLRLNFEDLAAVGVSASFGPSWRERVQAQLQRWGVFQLAYLEALLRSVDWRASALETEEMG